jgi:hypothetical protein
MKPDEPKKEELQAVMKPDEPKKEESPAVKLDKPSEPEKEELPAVKSDKPSELKEEESPVVMKSDEPSEPTEEEKFAEYIDTFIKGNSILERFFGNKKDFIQVMAQKAANLRKNPHTDLGNEDLLPKTVKVSMHQQVLYCGKLSQFKQCSQFTRWINSDPSIDDSGSMSDEGRWNSQKKLITRITHLTTQILPEGEGVALRFINREVEKPSNLTLEGIGKIMDPMLCDINAGANIGTSLRSKVLEPLVYNKINTKNLERPLLITIMTDGVPGSEGRSVLSNAMLECGKKLQEAGYPRESTCLMPDTLLPIFPSVIFR